MSNPNTENDKELDEAVIKLGKLDRDAFWGYNAKLILNQLLIEARIDVLEKLKGLASIDDNYARMPEYLEAEISALQSKRSES